MPRINIEEKLWTDPRFNLLTRRMAKEIPSLTHDQAQELAIGTLVRAWRAAQNYWVDQDDRCSGIPIKVWEGMGFPAAIIDCDLASVVDGEVFLRGIGDAFAWLESARQNGKKGGRPKKSNDLETQPKPNPNPTETQPEPRRNLLTLTLTPTLDPTLDLILDHKNLNTFPRECLHTEVAKAPSCASEKTPRPKKPKTTPPTTETWEAYREAYLLRYKVEPVRNAAVNGQLAQFVSRVGAGRAPDLMRFYVLSCNDGFVLKERHPVRLALLRAEALNTDYALGTPLTNTQSIQGDRMATNRQSAETVKRWLKERDNG